MYTIRDPADELRGRLQPYLLRSEHDEGRQGVERWRLFVALPLPAEITEALARIPSMLSPRETVAIRWIDAEAIHLTLQFIGDTDPTKVSALSDALDAVAGQSGRFRLRLGPAGAFPSLPRPRIFWIGLDGEVGRLKRLQGRVEGALVKLGIPADARPFEPHLTVARLHRDPAPRAVHQAAAAFGRLRFPDRPYVFAAEQVVLFRSFMSQAGARYEALHQAPLG